MQMTIILTNEEYDNFLSWKYRYSHLISDLMHVASILKNIDDQKDRNLIYAISLLSSAIKRYE